MLPTYIAHGSSANRYERIPLSIYPSASDAVKIVANEIKELILEKQKRNQNCVLGFTTGISPILLYKELVRMHKEENLSFKNVIAFNLDEYLPMSKESHQSVWYFMHNHLFDHIDILPENIHIPDGQLIRSNLSITSFPSNSSLHENESIIIPEEVDRDIEEYCKKYEKKIQKCGGIDLQILGIGQTGHIGFNEPGSLKSSLTRRVFLNDVTIRGAAPEFGGLENAPRMAITMGIDTILRAKHIILLAWGEIKAGIIAKTLETQSVSEECPSTFLQEHSNCTVVIDQAAASKLIRAMKPWLVTKRQFDKTFWTPYMMRKAVLDLCRIVKKPILKLTSADYVDNGLIGLLKGFSSANQINVEVFNQVQHTITGWPGGKPNVDDSTRPERNSPYPKTILVFSPHPDDDVIHMGGTLARLVEQGHNVHVVYQVTGNIAVTDDYILQEFDTMKEFANVAKEGAGNDKKFDEIRNEFIDHSFNPAETDNERILKFKTHLLESESRSSCRYLGIPEQNIHFLHMPFYETGRIQKKPLSDEDIDLVVKVLRDVKPDSIFAAGDLVDPHGTHFLCLESIIRAFNIISKAGDDWFTDDKCYIWLYRGASYEWELERIDMAVPISPAEMQIKTRAIYKHGSQCNFPAFPGQFRIMAEKRNRNTAKLYDTIGMPEYEAIEAFARYHFKEGDYLIHH